MHLLADCYPQFFPIPRPNPSPWIAHTVTFFFLSSPTNPPYHHQVPRAKSTTIHPCALLTVTIEVY